MTDANTRQVGGTHYQGGAVQHWDLAARLRMGYFDGQITKYVCRWKSKNGLRDLEKAEHFTQKYMEVLESWGADANKPFAVTRVLHPGRIEALVTGFLNQPVYDWLSDAERLVIRRLSFVHDLEDLQVVRQALHGLIQQEQARLAAAAEPGRGYVRQE